VSTDGLAVDVRGRGPRAVLVHGSGHRDWTWEPLLPLEERWTLVLPWRFGYGASPRGDPDFEVDARLLVELLRPPAHLVGFSYGGVASLLAAAAAPGSVRSLTLIEPPAFAVAMDDDAVRQVVSRLDSVYGGRLRSPEEHAAGFVSALTGESREAEALGEEQRRIVESHMRERAPWLAQIPLAELERAPFRTLVVSGGWSEALDTICDRLAHALNAERATFPSAGHSAHRADGFVERLERFWREADRARRSVP
jgi:pimeloyl-ACP methyl ester carboxylesterase